MTDVLEELNQWADKMRKMEIEKLRTNKKLHNEARARIYILDQLYFKIEKIKQKEKDKND